MLRHLLLAALVLTAPALAQAPTDAAPPAGRAPAVYPPAEAGLTDTAWGYDARYLPAERTLLSFPLGQGQAPADGPDLASPDGALVQGCDFDDADFSRMLCVSAAGLLFRVALPGGETEAVGQGSYAGAVADLTYSVADDAWYALASTCADETGDPTGDRSALARVDPATGAATAVGPGLDASFCGLGLAAAPGGELYAYSAQTRVVASRAAQIDPATGAFDFLGATNFDAFFAQSMDCDAAADVCYAFGYQGSGVNGLYELNRVNGRFEFAGDLPEGAELTAAAIAASTADVVSSEASPSASTALRLLSATPARGTLRLAVGTPGVLEVTDALGRRVLRRDAVGPVTLDVSRWAPGLYVLRLAAGGAVASRTVLVSGSR